MGAAILRAVVSQAATRQRETVLRAWDRFWFQDVPPHIYALLRIGFGFLGLISLLGLTPVSMFWTPDGIAPLVGGGLGIKTQLLSLGLGALAGYAFFAGALLSFICMTGGFLTRWAVAGCFGASVLQTFWNYLPLSSSHQVLVVMLFCLLWADCGAVWSVDAWLVRERALPCALVPEAGWPIWPLRLIRFQVALIYLNSGLWKLFGAAWRDGSAVHYVVSQNVFRRFPSGIPPSFDWLATVATYVTLFWEMSFAMMLLHPRSRRLALLAGITLHLGMWATLELGPFSWVMIATYAAFLDPAKVSRLAGKTSE